jgi:hypothetical protein
MAGGQQPVQLGYAQPLKWIGDVTGFNDDVFPAQIVSLSITSDDFRWGDGTKMSPETTIEFRGHEGSLLPHLLLGDRDPRGRKAVSRR